MTNGTNGTQGTNGTRIYVRALQGGRRVIVSATTGRRRIVVNRVVSLDGRVSAGPIYLRFLSAGCVRVSYRGQTIDRLLCPRTGRATGTIPPVRGLVAGRISRRFDAA